MIRSTISPLFTPLAALAVLVSVGTLPSCAKQDAPVAVQAPPEGARKPTPPPPPPKGDAAWRTCKTDADCVAVELGCCDHCNGGEAGAFNKSSAAQAKAALGPKPGACDNTPCTEMACDDAAVRCKAGSCEVVPEP